MSLRSVNLFSSSQRLFGSRTSTGANLYGGWTATANASKATTTLTLASANNGTYSSTADKTFTILVLNLNDNDPVFTSSATFSAAENQTAIGTVTATDEDGDPITYSVSGSEIEINSSTGVLTFKTAPDYETKSSYTATVTASDGTNSTSQSITVSITDIVEVVLQTNSDSASVDEDNEVSISPLSNDTIVLAGFTLSLSTSTPSNGAVEVNNDNSLTYTPNENFYGSDSFIYTVTVNGISSSAEISITVNSINDLPIINSLSSVVRVDENQKSVVSVNASDIESSSLSYSLSGTDSSLFSISSSGVITFNSNPDYEDPSDSDANNSYVLTVSVSDGSASVSQAIAVNIQNVADLVSGLVLDGYVAGATVFQDLDNDGILDSGEPNTSTNSLGSFSLTLSSVSRSAPVRIINGYDLASNEIHPSIMDISTTETGDYIISPISTLVGRLKIKDSSLTEKIPESVIAASLGISITDSPNDSILGFDPIAYFTGSDATLASEAKPVFASSQLLMSLGGGNYSINKYIIDQSLSELSTRLTNLSGQTISLNSSSDIQSIKQDAYDAISNGFVNTVLALNPPINNVQFKNNKAVMTDYLDGSTSRQVDYSLYGVHDGDSTLVADLIGANLDYENLKQILDNDGTGNPMDLSFELSNLPIGSGTTSVNLRLYHGEDVIQGSDEDYLQVSLTADWESDGSTLEVKLPANSNLVATFFDRGGTQLSRTYTNLDEDILNIDQDGPNRPASLNLRLSKLFTIFPTEVSGLSNFLDGKAKFTYQVEFGNFTIYDHLKNSFNKIQGTFGVTSNPGITLFVDDIYVHENSASKEVNFYISQASSSDISLNYSVDSSSSASSSDHSLSSGTITIPAGSTSTSLDVPIINDSESESQEELKLNLSNIQNANLGRQSVSIFITDGEKILDNSVQKNILIDNTFKESKSSINAYIKNLLDTNTVTISGTTYTYSQVLVNNNVTSDVYSYLDGIIDDYESVAETLIGAIMTKVDNYVDAQISDFVTYYSFAQGLTQINSGIEGLNISQIIGTNINKNGSYPSGQDSSTLQTALDGKVDTLVTFAADTVADILGEDTNTNFPNALVTLGTEGNDNLTGTVGSDLIATFSGTDTVNALAGNDKILGGSGIDTLNGGDGNDHIYGYAGADTLNGNADDDLIYGGKDANSHQFRINTNLTSETFQGSLLFANTTADNGLTGSLARATDNQITASVAQAINIYCEAKDTSTWYVWGNVSGVAACSASFNTRS